MPDIGGVFVDNGPISAQRGYLVRYNATRDYALTVDVRPGLWTTGTFKVEIKKLECWLCAIGARGLFEWHVVTFSAGRLARTLYGDSGQAAHALVWGILARKPDDWLLPLLSNVVVTGSVTEAERPHGWDALIGPVGAIESKLKVFAADSQRLELVTK